MRQGRKNLIFLETQESSLVNSMTPPRRFSLDFGCPERVEANSLRLKATEFRGVHHGSSWKLMQALGQPGLPGPSERLLHQQSWGRPCTQQALEGIYRGKTSGLTGDIPQVKKICILNKVELLEQDPEDP